MKINKNCLDIVLVSLGIICIYFAFYPVCNIMKITWDCIRQHDGNYTGDGYYSLSIINGVFAVFSCLSPSIICLIGPKVALISADVCFLLFILNFIFVISEVLYVMSVLVGIALALIWTSFGIYFTLNSSVENVPRNDGLFWGFLQLSTVGGNLFIYFRVRNHEHFSKSSRITIFGILAGVCAVGLINFIFLRVITDWQKTGIEKRAVFTTLKKSVHLFCTKDMALLYLTFSYVGLVYTYITGVYGSSIAYTDPFHYEDVRVESIAGLSGVFIGTGEVLGGLLFGLYGSLINRGNRFILIPGFISHMLAYILICLNLPNDAPFGNTQSHAILDSNIYLAMFCAFLLGFGDSVYNTQIIAVLGRDYAEESALAFSLFKFWQALFAAISFFYSSHLGLYWQLGILAVFSIASTVTFFIKLRASDAPLPERIERQSQTFVLERERRYVQDFLRSILY